MKFFSSIPEGEPEDKFERIEIDGRTFYSLNTENKTSPRRRYSDQFRDPLFIAKDVNRKLNMIKQFKNRFRDIDSTTEKYISCIEECICVLKRDFMIEPRTIFQAFDLRKLGINPEDFGVDEDNGLS